MIRNLINLMSAVSCLALSLAAHSTASAQMVPKPEPKFLGVGIDQNLEAQVPLDLTFFDEEGREVKLGDYVKDKPVVLNLVYYQCPKMCGMVLYSLLESVQAIPLQLEKDYHILTISIDPREKPALAKEKKAAYVAKYARDGAEAGWHFLTGPKESSEALAKVVGFNYEYDPLTDQFAHAAGIMVLTPQGKVSKYLYGAQFDPRSLRLALVESSQGKIGSAVDQFLLLCFHYDPLTGKYGLAISFVLQACGVMTVLMLGVFVVRSLKHDRDLRAHPAAANGPDDVSTPQ